MSHSQSSTAFAAESGAPTLESGEAFLVAFRSHQPAEWLSSTDRRLTELLELPPNWNSYDGNVADQQSVADARSLVMFLAEIVSIDQPDVGLTPDGLATLSWELDGSREVEVEIGATGAVSINHFDDTVDLHQTIRTRDSGQLVELLTRWSQEG